MIKFRNVLSRYEARKLPQMEAGELLGINERTFRRRCERYEEEGKAGLLDRRLGQTTAKRVPAERASGVARLCRTRHAGFTARHSREYLVCDHGFIWTKTHPQSQGLRAEATKRRAHQRKRPRRPLSGMIPHQDGSRHAWLAGQDSMDLIVTMDDATNEIYSAFLIA